MSCVSIATLTPAPSTGAIDLPRPFLDWFASKGWQPRAHQLELLALAEAGKSALLIAPTGAGKTLAGFLPALTDLARRGKPKPGTRKPGIHTLYISPLKALAVDIHRNLSTPVDEMGLPVTIETRTGDTPQSKRQRQKLNPPDILLTTPEQLAHLLSHKDAEIFFSDLRHVVLDELHSLVTSKRGHMLALGLARLHRLCPGLKAIGLSATVADPDMLRGWLVPQQADGTMAELVTVAGGAKPDIAILESRERVPWSGHSARYSMPEVYEAIRAAQDDAAVRQHALAIRTAVPGNCGRSTRTTCRSRCITARWMSASGARSNRRCRPTACAPIVATSTLDLGIDWGDVDLVVHVGSPKGASRLAQRIGRANHRMDEASKAILVPANRFEVMECQAALDANYLGAQDTPPLAEGALDVLCQHILCVACAEPFYPDALYAEIVTAAPYREPVARHVRPGGAIRRPWRLRAAVLRALCAHPARRRTARGALRTRRSPSSTV